MTPARTGPKLRGWPAWVMAAACIVASASAATLEPGEGEFRSADPPHATGIMSANASLVATLIRGEIDNPIFFRGDPPQVDVVRVRVRAVQTPAGDLGLAPEHSTEAAEIESGNITIAREQDFEMLAFQESGTASVVATTEAHPLILDMEGFAYSYRMNASLPYFYGKTIATPGITIRSDSPGVEKVVATLNGEWTAYVTGAMLLIETREGPRTIALGSQQTAVASAFGASAGRTDEYSYARIRYTSGLAALEGGETFLATSTSRLEGTLACDQCDSRVDVPRRRYQGANGPASVSGTFDITIPLEPAEHAYVIRGEFASAQLGERVSYVSPAIVSIAFASLAIMGALLLKRAITEMLAQSAASLYTRLTKRDILESQERSRIATLVATEPGIHMREMQRRLGFGWGKLDYHVGVMERTGYLVLEKRGRNVHAFPAGTMPTMSPGVLKARGAAHDIYEKLCSIREATVAELALSLQISRQLAGYHLRRLEREGLVLSEGTPARYRSASPAQATRSRE